MYISTTAVLSCGPHPNPWDYCLGGYFERKVSVDYHPKLRSLKASITENMAALDRHVVARSRFRSCLQAKGSCPV